MIATDKASAVIFQPILAEGGTRIDALRAAADPSGPPARPEDILEHACAAVASWNRRHPSLAVDLVVDLAGCTLDTPRIDQAVRFALARTGLGGDRLRLSALGLADDPALARVRAAGLARLLLPQRIARRPR